MTFGAGIALSVGIICVTFLIFVGAAMIFTKTKMRK